MSSGAHFTPAELKEYEAHFASFDGNGDGFIDRNELILVLKNTGLYQSDKQVDSLIKEVDKNNNGVIELAEFLDIVYNIKSGNANTSSGFAQVYTKQKDLIQVKGHSGVHSFAEEEVAAFSEHLNTYLTGDVDVAHLVPIDPKGLDLARKVRDGIVLSKFINIAVKDTIDVRALNLRKGGKDLSLFQVSHKSKKNKAKQKQKQKQTQTQTQKQSSQIKSSQTNVSHSGSVPELINAQGTHQYIALVVLSVLSLSPFFLVLLLFTFDFLLNC